MPNSRIKFYHSIRFKLSAIMGCVIAAAVIALSLFNAAKSLERETESFQALTLGAASAYAATVADAVDARDRMRALSALRGIRDLPNIVQADITLNDGEVFVELGSGAWLLSERERKEAFWQQRSIRVVFPIVKSGEKIGQIGMLADIQPLRSEILTSFYLTIFAGLSVGLLGILAAQLFVSRLTAPLKRLTTTMSQIRDGDELHPADDLRERKDETGLLTTTFSDMIDTIRDRDQQIAHHMNTLEQTVEERTHDLRVARDEAEAANAAKSDFLATMSHEIRTPMNGMMVMAEMLGAADLTPRHKRYADIIHRSGNSLLTIINDILDLSKIEAGQLDLESIPTSPEALVTDVAYLFWERARSKELDLATYVSPRVPDEVLCDPTRLNQVISNLVNNALKFTESGGVLVRVDAEHKPGQICRLIIEVIDTGVGIPEDKVDHIFESFSQADQSTTRRFGGTGLGLTVCRRLVTAMGGEIKVQSAVGKGSTFRVEFDATINQASEQLNLDGLRIGINLPESLSAIALAQSLSDFGCDVVEQNADVWISTSASYETKSDPTILLTDIGDTDADRLIRNGMVQDLLAVPYRRSDLAAQLERVRSGAYRGVDALTATSKEPHLQNSSGLRVLAVDDNAVNREVIREALLKLKVDVSFAENGEQALRRFETEAFDVVFMDGSMPIMDGFESTRHMRAFEAEHNKSRTPIYALTAQVAGTNETAWQDVGADGHILKPFSLEKLASVLSQLTDDSAGVPVNVETENDTGRNTNLLDQATVSSLEQLGTEPNIVRDKVWDMFQEKAPKALAAIAKLATNGPSEALSREAHALKSMALSSGFKAMADHLQNIEEIAKSEDASINFAPELRDLSELFDSTQIAVEDYRSTAA